MNIYVISETLNIRPQRLRYKASTLNIIVHEDGTIKSTDINKLIESYLYSKKTSDDTKSRAARFLGQFDGTQKNNIKNVTTQNNLANKTRRKRTKNKKTHSIDIQVVIDLITSLFLPVKHLVLYIVASNIKILESVQFKFIALIVAISVQMHHSAIWFQRVTPDEHTSVYAAYGYAFMVDLFILVVTMEGKLSIAKTFATLTFLSNVLYFQFWVNFDYTLQAYTNAISSLLISGIMAYIIYAYTELFVKYRKNKS